MCLKIRCDGKSKKILGTKQGLILVYYYSTSAAELTSRGAQIGANHRWVGPTWKPWEEVYFLVFGLEAQRPKKGRRGSAFAARGSGARPMFSFCARRQGWWVPAGGNGHLRILTREWPSAVSRRTGRVQIANVWAIAANFCHPGDRAGPDRTLVSTCVVWAIGFDCT